MAEKAVAGECMTEDNLSGGADIDVVIIKKYANRRLYNTATSSYVTLDHLSQMVKEGTDFTVHDAKSGEDITHQVLTQIIVEEEAKGKNLLPISFLRRLIRLYDDSMQAFVPRYLELTMENFSDNQERMRSRVDEAFGGIFPVAEFEEMGRQNMAAFQKALNIFSPLGAGGTATGNHQSAEQAETQPAAESSEAAGESAEAGDEISLLKGQLDNMQAQLDKLARRSDREE
jgi:polyhydroxyalkanoate synthesis repressor PhaR